MNLDGTLAGAHTFVIPPATRGGVALDTRRFPAGTAVEVISVLSFTDNATALVRVVGTRYEQTIYLAEVIPG